MSIHHITVASISGTDIARPPAKWLGPGCAASGTDGVCPSPGIVDRGAGVWFCVFHDQAEWTQVTPIERDF